MYILEQCLVKIEILHLHFIEYIAMRIITILLQPSREEYYTIIDRILSHNTFTEKPMPYI